jgi:exopolysaccharide biosynthesis polyprenyl glycosylphosphotransferase
MNERSTKIYRSFAGLDSLFAFAMALASVVYGNNARIPTGEVQLFLQMRITLANAIFAGFFMVLWNTCFQALARREASSLISKLAGILRGCAVMSGVLALYLYLTHTKGPIGRIAIIFFLSSTCYEVFRLLVLMRIASRDPQRVIILGSGRRASKAWRELRTRYHSAIKVLGFVDDRSVAEMAPDIADRYLGSIDDLSDLLLRNVVDELLIALPMKSCYGQAQRAVSIAEQVGVHVVYMQDMYASQLRQSVHRDQDLFADLAPFHEHYVTRQAVKRVFDLVGALIGLCLLAPVFAVISLAVKLTSPGPVLFVQERYGFRRRRFHMYKFRSMVKNAPALMAQLEHKNEAAGPIFKIKDDPRITRLGRFLRASSLDEFPQLFNVLMGHMSLVGPRPMSVRDVSLFSEATLMRRFTMKPGITGLWQVSGRSSVGFDQWMKMDFNYIDDWSLALDFQILARTVKAVVKRTGAV